MPQVVAWAFQGSPLTTDTALVRLTVPRLSSHSGPDNQKGYRTDEEIAADVARDPLPRLRAHLVPAVMSESETLTVVLVERTAA